MEKITQDEKTRYFEVIQILKDRIKEMAKTQKELKQKRYRSDLMFNRYKITALLNFYLEFRGKVYRHAENNTEYQKCWIYQHTLTKLHEEFIVKG